MKYCTVGNIVLQGKPPWCTGFASKSIYFKSFNTAQVNHATKSLIPLFHSLFKFTFSFKLLGSSSLFSHHIRANGVQLKELGIKGSDPSSSTGENTALDKSQSLGVSVCTTVKWQ